jgi:hypothetical protein
LLSNLSRIINRQLDEKTAHLTSRRTGIVPGIRNSEVWHPPGAALRLIELPERAMAQRGQRKAKVKLGLNPSIRVVRNAFYRVPVMIEKCRQGRSRTTRRLSILPCNTQLYTSKYM